MIARMTFRIALTTLLAAVAWLALPGCGEGEQATIKIDGSSTVYPITEAVAEEFRKVRPDVRVVVGVSGTGGGFKRFIVGETDISDASRPIKPDEAKAAKGNGVEYIELPVAYDGLSIVVNKQNGWVDHLTVDELKKIFLSDVKAATWADVRDGWPSDEIKIYSPGTDSGTFDYFKEVVAGKSGAIRDDMSVSEDDNVLVTGVAGTKAAIGFFGCAYYFENKDKLRVVPIDGGAGPVEPTPTTIEDGSYAPFSRPLFIYVNTRAADRPEVKAFVEFYLDKGPALAEEVGYVKLPQSVYDAAKKRYADKKAGSAFLSDKGESVKGSVTELYN